MFRLTGLTVRAIFLIGFIIALPVLALPKVSELANRFLYGEEKTIVGDGATAPAAGGTATPYGDVGASPASFNAPLFAPESSGPTPEQAAWQSDLPPTFGPGPRLGSRGAAETNQPAVGPPDVYGDGGLENSPSPAPPSPFGEEILAQLAQIREALELMGAQSLVLHVVEGTENYRFHCEVLLAPQSPYTRQFEAVSPDPLLAAETVLAEVTRWRQSNPPAR